MGQVFLANVFGFIAAGIGAVMFLPQVLRCWKTKHTKDISFLTYFLLATASIFWVAYGLMIRALPVISVNIIILMLSLFLLFLKKKYG